MSVIAGDDVHAIAEEVFAAMIDGEPGTVLPWAGPAPTWSQPLVAWVDLHGAWSGRACLTTERPTAHALARALLTLPADEEVGETDLVDAFGEMANVVGGNIKSLLPVTGTLGLPRVATEAPATPGASVVTELALAWHGRPLVLTVLTVPGAP